MNYIKSFSSVFVDKMSDQICLKYNKVVESISNNYNYYVNNEINNTNNKKMERIYKKMSCFETPIHFFSSPTYIVDNLYLGSAFNAGDSKLLEELNVGLVINVTSEITNYFEHNNKIKYVKFNVYDNNKDTIQPYFEESYKLIKEFMIDEKNKDKQILVHCFMGASRSASIIISYLLHEKKIRVDDALEFLKNKRPCINLSKKIYNELKSLEYDVFIENENIKSQPNYQL